MLKSKECKIELEGHQIERMRSIINAIKDLNVTTSDKAGIDYDTIRELDGADNFLAKFFGLVQPIDPDFGSKWYADYRWDEDAT